MGTSGAKAPQISGEFLAFLPQIEGYFRFRIKKSFDVPFMKNLKGGMNAESCTMHEDEGRKGVIDVL
jgi:hypothetical protein